MNEKETIVPYKICSFDIEASSCHGDFPLAIKDYTKLARDMLNYMENIDEDIVETLKDIIYTAFDLKPNYIEEIQNVYPKNKIDENYIQKQFNLWIKENYKNINAETKNTILNYYNKQDDDKQYNYQKKVQKIRNNTSIIELLKSNMEHDDKINYIN